MNGSFRKKPNGSVELRVWLDMPDGSHVQIVLQAYLVRSPKAAYEEFRARQGSAGAPADRRRLGTGMARAQREVSPVPHLRHYELYFNHYYSALGKMQLSKLHQSASA